MSKKRSHKAPKRAHKKAPPKPAETPTPSAEPTFSPAEFAGVFGTNYEHYGVGYDRIAMEALDDAARAMGVAYQALDALGDDSEVCDALYNAKCRAEVAQKLILKMARGVVKAEVAS